MCTRPESSPDAPGVCLQHVQLTKGTFRVAPTQLLTNQRLWQERGANRSVEHQTFCADPQEGSCSCPSSGETQVLREAAAGRWEPPGTRKDASSLRLSRGRGSRVIGCLRRLAAASPFRGPGGGWGGPSVVAAGPSEDRRTADWWSRPRGHSTLSCLSAAASGLLQGGARRLRRPRLAVP